MTDLNLYRVFYDVARTGSLSKAAEALYISQPALSKSIAKLEKRLDIVLFDRTPHGMSLTHEGNVLFTYVEKALDWIDTGEGMLEKLKHHDEGSIRIGVSTTLCKHYLLPKLDLFKKTYPNYKIQIINKTTLETLQLLQKGFVDICLVSEPPKDETYDFIKITSIHDVFVANQIYLNQIQYSPGNGVFPSGSFMLLESDNISRQYIEQYFGQHHIQVTPDIQSGDMDVLISLAEIGMGIACVIKEFVSVQLTDGRLLEIKVDPDIPKRNIGIVHLKNIRSSLAAQTFTDYIRDTCA
ncbi:LysR family transcriptional regulator [Ethanoligenens harbinense]|uniref:Transcriptional regulator, LysR family n=1 Tax=Ethanoligenens harbinense (strain DSM 18485 / JCM 12961 / CGMCC 1.5033 / YUAN-3) TaxID=663278 RepID=E6U4N9_ETHHY|nr:LysR family transcriptional regulator [Ethanoligenens harbinense]ADU26667.1 transcriptional regulator, LysR family [Ethanoligenens harbinense YUAN-3]AVQ95785.1 LysR family transcriptional regulator [Ethanoligenens harbinense YUAN-3]AYF38447.1 LysR family transcriptional regulator [Ethanoligenens harbinense]AYF41192.1 LysR family transcriptional regulator [Ethanoligenens harbinense]QCN92025.1 LysR family transcriptional regulator [Ethanoligenens harbinense]